MPVSYTHLGDDDDRPDHAHHQFLEFIGRIGLLQGLPDDIARLENFLQVCIRIRGLLARLLLGCFILTPTIE